MCEKLYTNPKSYNNHLHTHRKEDFLIQLRCPHISCKYGAQNVSLLTTHIRKEHGNAQILQQLTDYIHLDPKMWKLLIPTLKNYKTIFFCLDPNSKCIDIFRQNMIQSDIFHIRKPFTSLITTTDEPFVYILDLPLLKREDVSLRKSAIQHFFNTNIPFIVPISLDFLFTKELSDILNIGDRIKYTTFLFPRTRLHLIDSKTNKIIKPSARYIFLAYKTFTNSLIFLSHPSQTQTISQSMIQTLLKRTVTVDIGYSDDFYTLDETWEMIKPLLEKLVHRKYKKAFQGFYGQGHTFKYLQNLKFEVLGSPKLWYSSTQTSQEFLMALSDSDIFISNPPFSIKYSIITFLILKQKPFILIFPIQALTTKYFTDAFLNQMDKLLIICHSKRMKFIRDGKESYVSCVFVCWNLPIEVINPNNGMIYITPEHPIDEYL